MHLESRSECTRQTGALSQKSRLAWFSVSEPLSAQNLPGLVIIASISTLRLNIRSVSGAQVLLSVGKSRWFIIRAFSLRFLVHFSIDSCHFDYAHVLRSALHSRDISGPYSASFSWPVLYYTSHSSSCSAVRVQLQGITVTGQSRRTNIWTTLQ